MRKPFRIGATGYVCCPGDDKTWLVKLESEAFPLDGVALGGVIPRPDGTYDFCSLINGVKGCEDSLESAALSVVKHAQVALGRYARSEYDRREAAFMHGWG